MELSDAKLRIKRLFQREDITIEAAAEAAQVSTSTVRRWMNPSDDTDIGLFAFCKFAFAFDVSIDALMFPYSHASNQQERNIEREWRANMDWWDIHLSNEQKLAVLGCIKAVWQVSSSVNEKQLRITDPELSAPTLEQATGE